MRVCVSARGCPYACARLQWVKGHDHAPVIARLKRARAWPTIHHVACWAQAGVAGTRVFFGAVCVRLCDTCVCVVFVRLVFLMGCRCSSEMCVHGGKITLSEFFVVKVCG